MNNDNNQKKLRVFEAFAGIGAQASALKRMNINHEIVGIVYVFLSITISPDVATPQNLLA